MPRLMVNFDASCDASSFLLSLSLSLSLKRARVLWRKVRASAFFFVVLGFRVSHVKTLNTLKNAHHTKRREKNTRTNKQTNAIKMPKKSSDKIHVSVGFCAPLFKRYFHPLVAWFLFSLSTITRIFLKK